MTDNQVEVKKCCSELNCVGTAEVQRAVSAELETSDKNLKDLLESQNAGIKNESS